MVITKRPLMYWVKSSNLKLQFLLLAIILITVAARVLPLEMQKNIVNQAIGMKRVDLLFMYCAFYLAAVLVASGLKFIIAYLQTLLGQDALARMRKELYEHILTLPLSFFRTTSSGMVVSSLVTEVVPASEFVGQAIAVPAINLLTLIAFGAYMFYLNPLLAGLSLVIYPFVIIVVPRLQRRANEANKQRVDITRNLSSKIGEVVSGIHEVHANGSYRIENRKYGIFVEQLQRTRIVWTLYKQGIKSFNNFFQSLGPFILFIVGGYLAIHGRFDLGALVAFLSAYDKLYAPWKELMDFYQVYQDARVSYVKLMEYFDEKPEHLIEPVNRKPYDLQGSIQVKDLTFSVAGEIQLLKQVNLELKPGEHLALVGFSGSGKSTLVQCIAQLHSYTGGSVQIDGREVHDISKRDLALNLGVVSQSPFIFDGTIKENLLYSCEALAEDGTSSERKMPTLDEMIEVVQQVGLFVDVLRFGLDTLLETGKEAALVDKLIRVRQNFQDQFGQQLSDSVEFFDENRFLYFSSVAANLIFANPDQPDFSPGHLATNQYFLDFLHETQLDGPLINLGRQLAEQTMDILGNLPPDELFLWQSPITADEFDDYKTLHDRNREARMHELSEGDRQMLLRLALRFTPAVHKVVAMPEMLEQRIVEGRLLFRQKIQHDHPDALSFYRLSEYIHSQTILANILFGKPRTDHPKSLERINQNILHLLIEEDLLERIVELGMDFGVGTKGDRLSGGQRQKLAIARVFLKSPPILIMDEATSALDNASQKRIQDLLETKWKGKSTLISVIHRLDTISGYDKIGVMKAGKIIEMGTYDELLAKKGVLYEFIHGTKASAQ